MNKKLKLFLKIDHNTNVIFLRSADINTNIKVDSSDLEIVYVEEYLLLKYFSDYERGYYYARNGTSKFHKFSDIKEMFDEKDLSKLILKYPNIMDKVCV
jgi:hypothetical protein